MARVRLHHRIVIPFALVALLAMSAAAFVALSVASRALESRVQAQLLSAVGVIARSDLALNPAILRNAREITGAEVVTYTTDGEVLATTVNLAERPDLVSRLMAAGRAHDPGGDPPGASIIRMDCGVPCFVAFRRVEGRPDTIVALVSETSELAAGTQAVTRTILLAAALSVIVMMLASQVVARRVTAPLEHLIGFVRDLTPADAHRRAPVSNDEIGRLGRAFNEMLDRVERSQDALVRSEKLALAGLLAARVAHDIRNPLSSIKMQAQLLRSGAVSPDQRRALTAILHDIDQVESVIRDLLTLARPGELTREPASVNAVVREVLQQMSAQLAYRKIAIEVDLDDTLPQVSLDATRFRQALVNVLTNASDAMPTGGALGVRSRQADAAILIEVWDDGVGVDPMMIERVFDPFVSSKRDGVGLGLVNARAVVESHGGRIALERREPRGTCARIWLPEDTPATGGASSNPRHG